MNQEYEAEEGECIEFHEDGVCTCGTFRASSPQVENGKEFVMKSRHPMNCAQQFVIDHDDTSSFAIEGWKVEVMIIDQDDKKWPYDVYCEVEYKYIAL